MAGVGVGEAEETEGCRASESLECICEGPQR